MVHMHKNGKMYLWKLFQEWGEEGIKKNNGGSEFNDIFDIL
jgi:hypothetical protein